MRSLIYVIHASSFVVATATPLAAHGRLKLGGQYGTQLEDEHGQAVQLVGVSMFNPGYYDNCIQSDAFAYLRDHMGATLTRIPMDANHQRWDKMDAALDSGLYVILDYHYIGQKPQISDTAKHFWRTAAQRYKNRKNVIYELWNEPAHAQWGDIKRYHEAMLGVIRPIDPLAIVLAGTPDWSKDLNSVRGNKIHDSRVMYVKHFYAASHHDVDQTASVLRELPVFVSEWGVCDYTGNGQLDSGSAQRWVTMMKGHNSAGVKLSWTNWGWDDKHESCAYLNPGSCSAHHWSSHSQSGKYVDGYLRQTPSPSPSPSPSPPAHFSCDQCQAHGYGKDQCGCGYCGSYGGCGWTCGHDASHPPNGPQCHRSPSPAPSPPPTPRHGCCSWAKPDQIQECGSTTAYCKANADNCKQCGGHWVYTMTTEAMTNSTADIIV